MEELSDQLLSVGALAEPARRALYTHVLEAPGPVSREQAAAAVGMAVHSVKFHLDKLVAAGLLEVEYRRLTGRTGPGAGRPAKLYRRSDREVSVSVPPRRYDLAGHVLAAAVDRAVRDGTPVADTLTQVAHEVGHELATQTDAHAAAEDAKSRREEGGADIDRTARVLRRHGYEPRIEERDLCLANCPFDRLAAEHTELVCGLNLTLIGGVLDGLRATTLQARLAPEPGRCCVRIAS